MEHNARLSRRTLAGILVASVAVSPLVLRGASVSAQEATPASLGFELAPGVTGEVVMADGEPAGFRVQIAAKTTWEAGLAADPDIALVFGESGTMILNSSSPITLLHHADPRSPGDVFAADVDIEFTAGDYFVGPPFTAATIRNEGTPPTTLLITSLTPLS